MQRILIVFYSLLFAFSGMQMSVNAESLKLPHLSKRGRDSFPHWLHFSKRELKKESKIAHTAKGPIEYVLQGKRKHPVVLSLHGGFGGYDQGLLIASNLIDKGYTVLAVSRPGYLRTPLSVGRTAVEQADAMAALLDTLGIDKVAVLGFSAGSPVAFQFALRHPHKVWGVILECVGANPADAPIYTILNAFLSIGNVPELGPWYLYLSTRYYPRSTARYILPQDCSLSKKALVERINYVSHHKKQLKFLQELVYTAIPFNPRRVGVINDISAVDPWPTYPLSSLQKPTMVIQAKADSNGSYAEAVTVAQKIPGAELVTVHESGHFIWLGKYTKKWEKRLVDFLDQHKP